MKEFTEKLISRLEEKIKVTSLEIIVTGTKDKPYFEIKYKEVGKEEYNIGYSSYELNNVFDWKEECFEIINQLTEEYLPDTNDGNKDGWIPVEERLPEDKQQVLVTNWDYCVVLARYDENEERFIDIRNGLVLPLILAWQPLPAPYKEKGE